MSTNSSFVKPILPGCETLKREGRNTLLKFSEGGGRRPIVGTPRINTNQATVTEGTTADVMFRHHVNSGLSRKPGGMEASTLSGERPEPWP